MKRITISIISGIALIALILGVLPVSASESEGDIMEIGDYLSQSRYYPGASTGNSATEPDYPPLTAPAGELLTFSLLSTDPDNDSLSYSASNLPPGATFDPQTGTFAWMPGYDQAGIYPNVHFGVSDGDFIDSEDITIRVINYDRPPALDFIGDKLANEEELVQFTIQATDPDDDQLTYTASNLPPGANFEPQTRTFAWTPGLGQCGIYSGINFEVSDGKLTDFEDIAITVQAAANKTPAGVVFSVNSLRVRPEKVSTGSKVNISVLATNSGAVAGIYEVTLKINGQIEANKLVTLSSRVTEEVDFVTARDIAGVYKVDVNGLSDSFVVREEDKIRGRSPKDVLRSTFGWIRTILNKRSDA